MTGIEVETPAGTLRGLEQDGVRVFRGIPYAAPPVGPLRLRPPRPPEPWKGVREATTFGFPSCQRPGPMEKAFGASEGEFDAREDCLTLNVWAPPGSAGDRRPVMVWIHGGAFVTGSGSVPWYDGRRLAAKGDVVVVTLNYRLGVLGFLHLADVGGEGFASSGNLGLLDQVAALEWVRDSIDAFGGDPSNVTVFGESAGAMSIGSLLGLPAARGLFAKAILQSGAAHNVYVERDDATNVARQVLAELGNADDPRSVLDAPVERILDVQEAVGLRLAATGLAFQPVVDGTALPEAPLEAVRAGAAAGVAVLSGTNADEMRLFALMDPASRQLDEDALGTKIAHYLGTTRERGEAMAATYRAARPGAPAGDVYAAVQTDRVFRIPAARLAEAHTGAGGRVWQYLFSWVTPVFGGLLGSCHALEIPFVFDNLDRPGVELFTGAGADRQALADAMSSAWLAFARAGEPTVAGGPAWPTYDPTGSREVLRFDTEVDVVSDPAADERVLFDGVC